VKHKEIALTDFVDIERAFDFNFFEYIIKARSSLIYLAPTIKEAMEFTSTQTI